MKHDIYPYMKYKHIIYLDFLPQLGLFILLVMQ